MDLVDYLKYLYICAVNQTYGNFFTRFHNKIPVRCHLYGAANVLLLLIRLVQQYTDYYMSVMAKKPSHRSFSPT